MRIMSNLELRTINMLVKDSLNSETEVMTDSFSAYKILNQVISQHISKVLPPDKAGNELPWVHNAIGNAKRNFLNNFHHVDDTYLQNYLKFLTGSIHGALGKNHLAG